MMHSYYATMNKQAYQILKEVKTLWAHSPKRATAFAKKNAFTLQMGVGAIIHNALSLQ
jgi:hypothetical protein